MKTIGLTLGMLLLMALFASASKAQVQRTFVSGFGNDSNPCSHAAPCRSFTQAISQTSSGGEVVVLDSGGYGAFSISQAVSIIASPGAYAGISVFSGNGIDITAGSSDTVILRGLTLNNQGSTGNGIVFHSGGTLHVENCVVNGFGFTGQGVGVGFYGAGNLEGKDSIMRGNNFGIALAPYPGTAVAAIDQVRLEGSGTYGLLVENGSKVTVRNSIASGNSGGFVATALFGSAAGELNIENCVATNNTVGIAGYRTSTGTVTVRVSNSTVTDNGTGLSVSGEASLLSRGNNTVEGNGNNGAFTGTYPAK